MRFTVFISMAFVFLTGALACQKMQTENNYFPMPKDDLEIVKSESQSFKVDTVVSGLDRPWSMVFLPDNTVLIAERKGNIVVISNGKVQEKSIGGNVPKSLRDIKLHPNYKENGWIYLSYYIEPSEGKGGQTALMRGKLVKGNLVDGEVLYTTGAFRENGEWYGSKIAFDHQGYLYFTVGIRGSRKNAQDLSNPSGKTMRFNDDGSTPDDNPFLDRLDALPEIYTYGHRMHEGLVCDPKTGVLWSTEFGELGGDELNIIKPGSNYGWPEVTYSLEYSGEIISKDSLRDDIEPPVHHFKSAPSDLDFVYGDRYCGWDKNLFIGSLVKGQIMRFVMDGNVFVKKEELLDGIGRVRDVKFAPDQFLYVLIEDTGKLVRILPVNEE